MHFYLNDTIPMTRFTSSTFDVERKTTWFVTARFSIGKTSKPIPDGRERASVSGWIRAGSAPYRCLIDNYDLIKEFDAQEFVMGTRVQA